MPDYRIFSVKSDEFLQLKKIFFSLSEYSPVSESSVRGHHVIIIIRWVVTSGQFLENICIN